MILFHNLPNIGNIKDFSTVKRGTVVRLTSADVLGSYENIQSQLKHVLDHCDKINCEMVCYKSPCEKYYYYDFRSKTNHKRPCLYFNRKLKMKNKLLLKRF